MIFHAPTGSARAGAAHSLPVKRRLKRCAVTDSLAEDGERLFDFIRLHPALWKAVRYQRH